MPGEVIDRAYVAIEPTFKNFGGQVKKGVDQALVGVKQAASSAVKSVDDSTRRSVGLIRGHVAKLTSSVSKQTKQMAAGFAGAFAVVKVVDFFKSSVTAASDLNETISKTGQIFGQSALPGLMKFASGAATSLGQSKQEALDAAATFGIFGKSAGLQGPKLSGFSEKLVSLSGDMASFSNTTPQEAIEAVGAALRGETEPIRRYGVLLDDASLRQQAMAQGLTHTTKNVLTPQQRVLAAYSLILKQTGDQQGDFARTSGGLANQQRILHAQLENAKASLGRGLLPVILLAVRAINGGLIPAFRGIGRVLGDAVDAIKGFVGWANENRRVLTVVAAAITTLLLPALIAFTIAQTVSLSESIALWLMYKREAIAGAIKAVAAYTMTTLAAIRAGAIAVATFAVMVAKWIWLGAQSLLAAAKVAAAWLIAMGPIALVIAAVVGLVVIIVKNWTTIKNFTIGVWNAITGFVREHWKMIVIILTGGLGALVVFVISNWAKIRNFIFGVWNGIVAFVRDHWKLVVNILTFGLLALVTLIVNKWTLIKTTIANAITAIVKFVAALPGRIISIFANALNWLYQKGKDILTGMQNGMGVIWANVKTWLANRGKAVKDAVGDAATWLYEKGKDILRGLWAGIKALGSWLVDRVKSIIPGWIKDALGIHSPPDWAVDAGKWIARGLAHGISHFPHFIGNLANMARKKIAGLISIGSGFDLPGLTKGLVQQYAASLFPVYGWGHEQEGPLNALWQGESGWNYKATNPTSGAYGIPQALPPSKMSSAGSDWQTNAATQIRWGLGYIKERYGNPASAYSQWLARAPHWYAKGAWRIPADQLAFLHKGESVAPVPVAEKWRQERPGGGVDSVTLAQAVAAAVATALGGAEIRFDADGIATIVTKHQQAKSAKGRRR
jgi:hypothetical protein